MAKINNKLIYGLEDLPQLLDYLIGSKDKNGKTKNFSLQSIINLINGVNGNNVIQYQFFSEPLPDVDYTTPGAMFTNNNETDVNNFSSLILNKKTLGNYDLTILFDFLSGLEDLFIGVDNPSNPNNFFTFKITSISNQGEYFIFGVEPYNDMYIGELSNEAIYSIYWETKAWVTPITNLETEIVNINNTLDQKLNISDYNEYFQGKYTSVAELETAKPTGKSGDYAIIDLGTGEDAKEFLWDDNDSKWVEGGSSGAATTDALPEGSINLYFQTSRVLSTILNGISFVIGTPITSADNILVALGKAQKQINDLITAVSNIFQPNQLISSVAPTRLVNTFTFPANQYTALISGTVRTNSSQFVTTIGVATTDYKRVDLIYFKSDNTLDKIIGTESLTVAIRPDVPANSVAISFINVFGDVVETPTPITQEISFQDYFGIEKFKVSDYVRFKGATLDASTKSIIIDPLQPLSVYLDVVNGNDTTALLENASKPFKTINALLNALPPTNGETYTIYMTGGTVNFTRMITARNLRWIAYKATTLNFTNVMENDGVTHAINVFSNGNNSAYMWTFENRNISVSCTYVGRKAFSFLVGAECVPAVSTQGTIATLDWRSVSRFSYTGTFSTGINTNLIIDNAIQSPQLACMLFSEGGSVTINNLIIQYGTNWSITREANRISLFINKITQIGTATININFSAGSGDISLRNLNFKGTIRPESYGTLTLSGTISDNCIINFDLTNIVTGSLTGNIYFVNTYLGASAPLIFKNFSGKLGTLNLYNNATIVFDNCDIQANGTLVSKGTNTGTNLVTIKGFTTITQNNLAVGLFGASSPNSFNVTINGTLKTNATTYGRYIIYTQVSSTFKEELNKVVIRNKYDLLDRTLSSTTKYIIDANIVLLSGEFIEVPAGGLDFGGYGFDTSAISKNVSGESIFKSPVGGSGNLVSSNVSYYPGVGSVFNLTDSNGSHAIELNDVNFQGVSGSSVGVLNGYRQFTGTTCGFYFLSDGLTLEGNWNGFKITNSNVIGFGGTGTLFKKGVSTLFTNRFYIDMNLQIATGSKISDFTETNFTNNKSLQVVNCYNKVNGIIDDTTTAATFPNITPYSSKSYFVNNIGIKNSNQSPYGIDTANMPSFANDSDAAIGGVSIGQTYIETSTGYFKKRLT